MSDQVMDPATKAEYEKLWPELVERDPVRAVIEAARMAHLVLDRELWWRHDFDDMATTVVRRRCGASIRDDIHTCFECRQVRAANVALQKALARLDGASND